MTIELKLASSYEKIEPSGWKDILFFISVIGSTLFFFVCNGFMMRKKQRNYIPLKLRNTNKLIAMNFLSVAHIWSVLISCDYFDWGRTLEQTNCVLWNYWFPFTIALGTWFFVFIKRLFVYYWIFVETKINPKNQIKWNRILNLSLVMTQIFGSAIINIGNFSYLEHKPVLYCTSSLGAQIISALSIFIYLGITSYAIFKLSRVVPKKFNLNEYRSLVSISKQGFVVLCIGFFLQIYDGMISGWGRFIFGMLVIYIHMFAFIKIAGTDLYYSIHLNQDYIMTYMEKERFSATQLMNGDVIDYIPELREDFLSWFKYKYSESYINQFKFLDEVKFKYQILFMSDHSNIRSEISKCIIMISAKYLEPKSSFCIYFKDSTFEQTYFEPTDMDIDYFKKYVSYIEKNFILIGSKNYIKIYHDRPIFEDEDKRSLINSKQIEYLTKQLSDRDFLEKNVANDTEIKFINLE